MWPPGDSVAADDTPQAAALSAMRSMYRARIIAFAESWTGLGGSRRIRIQSEIAETNHAEQHLVPGLLPPGNHAIRVRIGFVLRGIVVRHAVLHGGSCRQHDGRLQYVRRLPIKFVSRNIEQDLFVAIRILRHELGRGAAEMR